MFLRVSVCLALVLGLVFVFPENIAAMQHEEEALPEGTSRTPRRRGGHRPRVHREEAYVSDADAESTDILAERMDISPSANRALRSTQTAGTSPQKKNRKRAPSKFIGPFTEEAGFFGEEPSRQPPLKRRRRIARPNNLLSGGARAIAVRRDDSGRPLPRPAILSRSSPLGTLGNPIPGYIPVITIPQVQGLQDDPLRNSSAERVDVSDDA